MFAFIHAHFTLIPLLIVAFLAAALIGICCRPGDQRESEPEIDRLKARVDALEKKP